MSAELDRVYDLVRQLSDEEQCSLLDRLHIHRIEQAGDRYGGFASEEIQRAWEAEIDRRMDDIEAGRGKSVPAEEVHRMIRGILDGVRKS